MIGLRVASDSEWATNDWDLKSTRGPVVTEAAGEPARRYAVSVKVAIEDPESEGC